ncbi:MAG: cation diffusion facilitator family transporter [Thermodesulfobacteriota bacterium]
MDNHERAHDIKNTKEKKSLTIVLALTACFMVVEAASGFYTGSLALLSDAAHMLTDVFALSLAYFALWFSVKPPTLTKTYGFYRAEILAALINGILLFVISGGIIVEAYERFKVPREVKSLEMTVVAITGLVLNLGSAYALSRYRSANLNIRGALYHVISDALGSAGAVIAGVVMLLTGWYYADSIISVLVSVLILRSAWVILRESVHILLEGTPRGMDLKAVQNTLCSHEGVLSVHDLHAWTLTQGFDALSAHLVVDDMRKSEELISDIKSQLSGKFHITHVTLQLETKECGTANGTCYEDSAGGK